MVHSEQLADRQRARVPDAQYIEILAEVAARNEILAGHNKTNCRRLDSEDVRERVDSSGISVWPVSGLWTIELIRLGRRSDRVALTLIGIRVITFT